jgi:hypothetical protein
MSHATCTQVNRVYSKLLVVESQIANLIIDLSFGHNLCFRCPNGSCKPILDIEISISFQWYKEIFNPLDFDPCNCSLTFKSPPELQLPMWEFPWECESLFSHALLHSQEHATWLLTSPLGSRPYNPLLWSRAQG